MQSGCFSLMQNVNDMHEEDLYFVSNVVSNFKYGMYCEFIDFPLLILGFFF